MQFNRQGLHLAMGLADDTIKTGLLKPARLHPFLQANQVLESRPRRFFELAGLPGLDINDVPRPNSMRKRTGVQSAVASPEAQVTHVAGEFAGGMDDDGSSVGCLPGAGFVELFAKDKELGPGLVDGDGFHVDLGVFDCVHCSRCLQFRGEDVGCRCMTVARKPS